MLKKHVWYHQYQAKKIKSEFLLFLHVWLQFTVNFMEINTRNIKAKKTIFISLKSTFNLSEVKETNFSFKKFEETHHVQPKY